MHIICPHCTTSYAIDLATLGASGRTVRCSRCKEVGLARPQDATEIAASVPAMAEAGQTSAADAAAEWDALAREDVSQETPVVDSPSISADWPADGQGAPQDSENDWPSIARQDGSDPETAHPQRLSWLRRLVKQTAAFYKLAGFDVNLRGLMFKDIKIATETVEGKPVLVIEGAIVGEARKPVELPRLRFSVRDAQGAEIYAWNAVLEQLVLKPGETAWFKSRLASPPPEGRNIDVRFFGKRDVAAGDT